MDCVSVILSHSLPHDEVRQDLICNYVFLKTFRETKIVLKGNGQAHLMELATKAASLHLKHYLVQDAGKTQVRYA